MARPPFPLIRHLSAGVTPWLLKTPLSANAITSISLGFGLAACWAVAGGTQRASLIGAGLLLVCYVLDNCDGEVARAKGQASRFGRNLDTFVDWLVHALFFVALGFGAVARGWADWWIWVGWVGFAGASINYGLSLWADRQASTKAEGGAPEESRQPVGPKEWFVFFFRELSRADFCFIVLGLALIDQVWLLLPAGAAGAQVYWLLQLVKGARDFRV